MASAKTLAWILVLSLAGCGDIADDLAPSGNDRRPSVQAGTTGPQVGQLAPAFTLPDSLGSPVTLADELAGGNPVVLYFTMWCPVCDGHMSHMNASIIPDFPDVPFFVIDYVSGSISRARSEQVANGYANAGFTVLADTETSVLEAYDGTMGTTVVVDGTGVIRMNEDYKDGSRLRATLAGLP